MDNVRLTDNSSQFENRAVLSGMNNLPDFILYIYLSVNFAGQILKTDYPSETETSGQLSATKFMQ